MLKTSLKHVAFSNLLYLKKKKNTDSFPFTWKNTKESESLSIPHKSNQTY